MSYGSYKMVPLTGLEPARTLIREILSLMCLPFHHSGKNVLIMVTLGGFEPADSAVKGRRLDRLSTEPFI